MDTLYAATQRRRSSRSCIAQHWYADLILDPTKVRCGEWSAYWLDTANLQVAWIPFLPDFSVRRHEWDLI